MAGRCISFVLLLGALSCGPDPIDPSPLAEDWMIGEFSAWGHEGHSTPYSVERLSIADDGIARRYSVGPCCGTCNWVNEGTEYPWERSGDAAIIWAYGVDGPDYLRVTFEDCNSILIQTVHDGEASTGYNLYRGEMCLLDVPCVEGVECDGCETIWCDEPPPEACP